ncbi:MAG: hypothetical protein HY820_37990 [Acidobacteria bacterium]|nr:hypothetical protein [Acidobacteriota bacterium]
MQPSMGSQATGAAMVTSSGFDWNNAAEQGIAGILGLVPEVGPLLSALVYIFWPQSKEDIWGEIEAQVEALIQKDLSQLVQTEVSASLQGLNNVLNDYLLALKDGTGDPTYISEKWNIANGDFLQQLPTFQMSGYQVLLLPLFAQFSNMHLSLLRDGVLGGAKWGWTPAILKQTQITLTSTIAAYAAYAQTTYQTGLTNVQSSTPGNNQQAQPFRAVNQYVRQMTLTVLDFMNMWQYFDVSKYPNGVSVYLNREIYSDPQGTCDDSGPIVLPSPPTAPISQISVWAWDRIDAVQLTYPAGGGPGGVTTTARMGDQGGGSNSPPHGGVFQVAANPVVTAGGLSGDIVNAMNFTFANGSSSGQLGGNYPGGGPFSYSYPNEILSSIHINGISNYYGSADCVVYGFKFRQSNQLSADTERLLYVTAPVVPSGTPEHSTVDQAARNSYWKHLATKAKH